MPRYCKGHGITSRTGPSSSWASHSLHTGGVAGSIPAPPTSNFNDLGQSDRAAIRLGQHRGSTARQFHPDVGRVGGAGSGQVRRSGAAYDHGARASERAVRRRRHETRSASAGTARQTRTRAPGLALPSLPPLVAADHRASSAPRGCFERLSPRAQAYRLNFPRGRFCPSNRHTD
jgi:hypothetical protein